MKTPEEILLEQSTIKDITSPAKAQDLADWTAPIYTAAKANYDENKDLINKYGSLRIYDWKNRDILFIGGGPSAAEPENLEYLKKCLSLPDKLWIVVCCSTSWRWCHDNDIGVGRGYEFYCSILDYRWTPYLGNPYLDINNPEARDICKGEVWLCYGGCPRKTLTDLIERGGEPRFFDVAYSDPYQLSWLNGKPRDVDRPGLQRIGGGINIANFMLGLAVCYGAISFSSIGDERSWKCDEGEADYGIKNMYSAGSDSETHEQKKTRIGEKVMRLTEKPKYICSVDLYNSRTWLFNSYSSFSPEKIKFNIQVYDMSDMRVEGIPQVRLKDIYNQYVKIKDIKDNASRNARLNSKKRRKERRKR